MPCAIPIDEWKVRRNPDRYIGNPRAGDAFPEFLVLWAIFPIVFFSFFAIQASRIHPARRSSYHHPLRRLSESHPKARTEDAAADDPFHCRRRSGRRNVDASADSDPSAPMAAVARHRRRQSW